MLIIYSKPNCPNCVLAKTLLQEIGVEFVEMDISVDSAAHKTIMSEGLRSVPQIQIDGKFIEGGYQGLLRLWREDKLK